MNKLIIILIVFLLAGVTQDPVKKQIVKTTLHDSTRTHILEEKTNHIEQSIDSIDCKLDKLMELITEDTTDARI